MTMVPVHRGLLQVLPGSRGSVPAAGGADPAAASPLGPAAGPGQRGRGRGRGQPSEGGGGAPGPGQVGPVLSGQVSYLHYKIQNIHTVEIKVTSILITQ